MKTSALTQILSHIEGKQYEVSLNAKGIPKGKIRKYGFDVQGKNVLIGNFEYAGKETI